MTENILIVDDEESIRFTFQSFLADEGLTVVTAEDYNTAIEKIRESDFALIFADIILGDRTGIDLLREVKRRNPRCPVVIITGVPNIETASEAVRLGAFDYLSKPILQTTLLHVTYRALKNKELEDELEKYRSNIEAIFRSVKEAIITVGSDLTVLEVNEAVKKLCGYTRADIGENLRAISRKCNGTCIESLLTTIKTKQHVKVSRLECQNTARPSQIVSLNTSPLLDSQGNFLGAVLVVSDETRLDNLERKLKEREQFHNIIGKNEKMQNIYSLIEDLADTPTTVLITGESGTGKELIAEALHYSGVRKNRPLVSVNCSALSENLLESELFGHVKGAFTGAIKDKRGRFEMANKGTLFLDEVGDISPAVQLKLLRVLQDKEFERVGESDPVRVDVRLVAATNQDLREKVKNGGFRDDLYYRLKVVELELPPLRQRSEDIPLLVKYFLGKFNKKFGKDIRDCSDDALGIFMRYHWPGNIRELEHAIEHAFILCRGNLITSEHLPAELLSRPESWDIHGKTDTLKDRDSFLNALQRAGWNKSKAARSLGISVRTMYRKIEKYNLNENMD
jgi:PAS domain S-box-containing protein